VIAVVVPWRGVPRHRGAVRCCGAVVVFGAVVLFGAVVWPCVLWRCCTCASVWPMRLPLTPSQTLGLASVWPRLPMLRCAALVASCCAALMDWCTVQAGAGPGPPPPAGTSSRSSSSSSSLAHQLLISRGWRGATRRPHSPSQGAPFVAGGVQPTAPCATAASLKLVQRRKFHPHARRVCCGKVTLDAGPALDLPLCLLTHNKLCSALRLVWCIQWQRGARIVCAACAVPRGALPCGTVGLWYYRTSTNPKANLPNPKFWHKVLQQYLSANTFNQACRVRIRVFTVCALYVLVCHAVCVPQRARVGADAASGVQVRCWRQEGGALWHVSAGRAGGCPASSHVRSSRSLRLPGRHALLVREPAPLRCRAHMAVWQGWTCELQS
jgi:hypothetical protein